MKKKRKPVWDSGSPQSLAVGLSLQGKGTDVEEDKDSRERVGSEHFLPAAPGRYREESRCLSLSSLNTERPISKDACSLGEW